MQTKDAQTKYQGDRGKKRIQLVPEKDFDAVWDRTFKALHCETMTELGQFLGVSKAAIWNVKDKRKYPSDWIVKLHHWYGISTDWLLKGRGTQKGMDPGLSDSIKVGDEYFIRMPHLVSANSECDSELDDNAPMFITKAIYDNYMRDTVSKDARLAWVEADDDALSPTIDPNDVLLLDLSDKNLSSNGVYLLAYKGRCFIRKVQILSGEVFLSTSDDPKDMTLDTFEDKGMYTVGRIFRVSKKL